MSETVLVTGGTGFIGRWCIVELLRRGYAVHTTIRSLDKEPAVRSALATVIDPDDRLTCVAADLIADDGWADAVSGCSYVLHVASPLGLDNASDPEALIGPARDGVLRVLQAATDAGVKRVVMTSAANTSSPISYTETGVTDETLWTDPEAKGLGAYRMSKTLAELAAWDFIRNSGGETTLTTVLPGAVFGPILARDNRGSVQVIRRLMTGAMPRLPKIGLEVVDVRDVVDIHLAAMTSSAAAGERFLATGEFMWMADIAKVLRANLGEAATKVPTGTIPNFMVRAMARRRPELRSITPGLGRKNRHTSAKAERLLGWTRRPTSETIIDCARSLIDLGTVA